MIPRSGYRRLRSGLTRGCCSHGRDITHRLGCDAESGSNRKTGPYTRPASQSASGTAALLQDGSSLPPHMSSAEKTHMFCKRRAIQSCKSRLVSEICISGMGCWDVHDSVRVGRSSCQVDGNASPPSNFQAKCTQITEDFST
jgi:hypothetical protein